MYKNLHAKTSADGPMNQDGPKPSHVDVDRAPEVSQRAHKLTVLKFEEMKLT